MSRIGRYLAREQGRVIAFWCGGAWLCLFFGACVMRSIAGAAIDAADLHALLCGALPAALQIGLPFAVAHAAQRRDESGEWLALGAIGQSPIKVAVWSSLPVIPALVAVHVAVHDVVPAAVRAVADHSYALAATSPLRLAAGLDSVGSSTVRGRPRLLFALGPDAVAVELDGPDAVSGRFGVQSGDAAPTRGRFGRLWLRRREGPRPLWAHGEAELTTATLTRRGEHWVRARGLAGDFDGRRRLRDELRRRRATVPGVALGVLIAMSSCWSRSAAASRPFWRHALLGLLAVSVSVSLPRLVG